MGELDKLFKDKLQDRTFEFKDAYWEDAERLIEQDEDDRRRRGGLWWKFGALLLVLAIAGFFFMDRQNSADIFIDTSTTQDAQTTNTKAKTNTNQLSNVQNLIDNSENSTINNPQNTNNKSKLLDRKDNVPSTGSLTPKTEVLSYEKNAPNSKTIQKGTKGSKSQDKLKEIKALDVENFDIQLPAPDTTTKRKEIAIQTTDLELDSKPIEALDIIEKESEEIGELALLETIAGELELPDAAECDGCFDFGKVKQNPFSLGIVVEGIAYPVKKGETNWRGGSIGLAAKYKLNRRFALNSGVQYSMIQGNGGRVLDPRQNNGSFSADLQRAEYDFYEENQYSFGLRSVSAIFPPKTFHSIDVPLTLQFSDKHSSFELGFQWNVLLGIRGSQVTSYSLFPWEQESLGASSSFEINEVKAKEWLPKDNYRKILTRLTVGYSYAFNPRFSVGVNAYYRTHKLNNTFSDSATSITAETTGLDSFTPKRFHVRLGATYFFK